MKFEEWLDALPFKVNPKGVRLDLRLYVYPDGHGNVIAMTEDRHESGNQPVNNLDELEDALRGVWQRGVQSATDRAQIK